MMGQPEEKSAFYRKAMSLLVGIVVFVLAVYTLEKTGVPRVHSTGVTGLFALIVVIATLSGAGSTRAGPFLKGDPQGVRTSGALAITALSGYPLIMLLGGAAFLLAPGFLVALIAAVYFGLAMAAVAVSRQFNATGTTDFAELLVDRHRGSLSARLLAATTLVPGIILSGCGILAGGFLLAWLFNLSGLIGALLFVLVCLLITQLGGVRSVLRFSAVAGGLLLVALNLPLLVHTLNAGGFPIGQLSAGYSALEPAFELESQLRSLGIARLADQIQSPSAVFEWRSGTQVLAALVVLFGTASLPVLAHCAAANSGADRTGQTIQRAILLGAFGGASLFALMAFTQIGFYQSNIGLTMAEAGIEAPYLYTWGERETSLVRLCGQTVTSAQGLLAACPSASEHILNVPDLVFDARLMLAASGELATLPFAYTALLTLALIAVLAAFSSGLALSLSSQFITAFYVTLPGKVASGRVFMIRICLVAVLAVALAVARQFITDMGTASLFALSLSATLFGTAIAGAFYLPRTGNAAMASALGIGFAICVLYYVLSGFGIDFTAGTGDEVRIGFPGMSQNVPGELGGVFALPVTVFVLAMVQLLSPQMERPRVKKEKTENGIPGVQTIPFNQDRL